MRNLKNLNTPVPRFPYVFVVVGAMTGLAAVAGEESPGSTGAGGTSTPASRDDQIRLYRGQLRDKDAMKRATAANQLGHLGASEAILELKELLRDASAEVQYFALGALIDLDVKDVVPEARRLLDSPQSNLRLRLMAVGALAFFGDKESLKPVLKLLRSREPHVRSGVAFTLGLAHVREASPSLEAVAAEKELDKLTRVRCLGALAMIGEKTSALVAARFLDDSDEEIRGAAIAVVARTDPEGYREKLREILRGGPADARDAALAGLASIGDKEAFSVLLESRDRRLLNYYNAPETCVILERTCIPRSSIRRKPVREVIRIVGEAVHKKTEVSPGIGKEALEATYGPNFMMLGPMPSAASILGSFNPWFLDKQETMTAVVEADRIRLMTSEEADQFWKDWKASKAAK